MTESRWSRTARRGVLLVLAWSLPTSLFGMQAAVVLGAALVAVRAVRSRGRDLSGGTPLDPAVVFLLGAALFSLLLAPEGNTSLRTAGTWWVVSAFYVTWFLLDSERTLRHAVGGLLILASAVALFAVFQGITGRYPLGSLIHPEVPVLLKPVPGMDGRVGGVGLFFSRLTLAHVLLFPFCWAWALLLEPQRLRTRLLLGAALLAMGAGLVFTWTRATLVVAALAAAGLTVSRLRGGPGRKLVVIAAIASLVAGVVVLSPQMRARMQRSFAGTRDWGRLVIWQTALDMASDHPLSGYGSGNFQRVAAERVQVRVAAVGEQRFPAVLAWAHSNLLSFLAEQGIAGAFAFCFLFVLYFQGAASRLRGIETGRSFLRGFLRGSIAAAGCFLAVGCFHDTFYDGEVIFTLWFTLAASLKPLRPASGEGGA